MAPSLVSPDAFVRGLTADRLVLAGFTGEPTAVIDALIRHPRTAPEACLTGVFIPGANTFDPAGIVPNGTVETFFVGPPLRAGFASGRVRYRPMHYSAVWREFTRRDDVDLVIVRTSPPRGGLVSLGLAHDFAPAFLARPVQMAAMIDPGTPFVADGVTIPLERFCALIDGPSPLVRLPDDPPREDLARIAAFAATLVPEGATVQTGIGAAPNAVLRALSGHKRLRLFGGMITDPGFDLLAAGVVEAVTVGAAAVSDDRAKALEREPRIRFRPVGVTHDAATIAAQPAFRAINSAIEIDLFGQANGEMVAGRQISGHGGVTDYVRGARLAHDGRSIMVMPATGDRGTVSRIVVSLAAGTPVAITRGDIDLVVTEFGISDIRDTDLDTRAERLIAIAAPRFRDDLARGWDARRRAM
jgi:acyl-CoA hydrolase